MWADTLLVLERAHLWRLMAWGASSLLLGTALLAFLRVRGQRSALLEWFAVMTGSWGFVDLAVALWGAHALAIRDLAGATRLDRFLWLNVGLDLGYVMVGLTLCIAGWRLGRRLGVIGAGTAVVVQGLALAVLDLVLAAQISR